MLRIFLFNLSGRLIVVAISLVSIPIYVRQLGIATYGLVGIYGSLSVLAGIFDVAFSNTISRELARRPPGDPAPRETGAVFRTLETFSWLVAAGLAIVLALAAGPLVNDWIGSDKYAGQHTVSTVRLMALLLLLQAPISFYSGCIYGFHRHGLINTINVCGMAVSAALSIFTVIAVSPTIDAYFISQFLGRCLWTGALAVASYVLLTRDVGGGYLRASLATWSRLWRFAVGMNGIGLLGLLATQADMIVLSRMLPATGLGYYTLARTGAQSLVTLAAPAYQSAFPQLSKLVGAQDRAALALTFHRFCQYMALVVIPPAAVICCFSREILAIWTRDPVLADNAWLTLSLLAAGSMVYGLNYMVSALQLANGAVRLMIGLGAAFVTVLLPCLILLAQWRAQVGAALAWLLVNVAVILLSAALTLPRFLKGELTTWFGRDILLPIGAAAAPVILIRSLVPGTEVYGSAAAALIAAAVLAVALSVAALPEGRAVVMKSFAFARQLSVRR